MVQAQEEFTPKTWLKSRRPERFSDSVRVETTEVDRSYLEFYLDSLSSRSQSVDFENFARKLCQKEICPNLLPQSGPTGGGDSKVDSETYPVSEVLSLNWFVGTDNSASKERWGFAFSTKKQWRPKLKADVKSIASTKRGYKKVFFVTNQTVSDKKRAELEDELSREHKFDVRILDRTWILDRVFTNQHQEIAIKELKATALRVPVEEKGPRDLSRESYLEKVEQALSQAIETDRFLSLPDLALVAADLARQLEKPNSEIEGRYRRAEDYAEKYGNDRQKFEVAYEWAWTLYHWLEDVPRFGDQYKKAESLLKSSDNVHDFHDLATLWKVLVFCARHGQISPKAINLSKRTKFLRKKLKELADDQQRPSNALQAATILVFVEIVKELAHEARPEVIDGFLRRLTLVIENCRGLVGYPLEETYKIIGEIGVGFEGSQAYDELFECLLEVWTDHNGELSSARMLLDRGLKVFSQEKYVDAISLIGRAIGRLYKKDSAEELIQALYVLGLAYENVGLLWASRGALINAASISMNEYWDFARITPSQAASCKRIKWLELRLGRLPQFLDWNRTDLAIREHLDASQPEFDEELFAHQELFDAALASLLLKANLEQLKSLESIPDVLRNERLFVSSDILLYALGHEEAFLEGVRELAETPEDLLEQCAHLVVGDKSPELNLINSTTAAFESRILGCKIRLTTPTLDYTIDLAESFLSGLESFLATVIKRRGYSIEPEFSIAVEESCEPIEGGLCVESSELNGRPYLKLTCNKFDSSNLSIEQDRVLKDLLSKAVIEACAQFVILPNIASSLEDMVTKERVFERAFSLASTFKTKGNVLGSNPRNRLGDWITKEVNLYDLRRERTISVKARDNASKEAEKEVIVAAEAPPDELTDVNLRNHALTESSTIIRRRLWDRAKWSGVVYLQTGSIPGMGLVFKNSAGRDIFAEWRKEFGKIDKEEKLRIVFVKGVDCEHKDSYRVCIGPKLERVQDGKFLLITSRINQMDPSTSANLDKFLAERDAEDCFFLLPAIVDQDWDSRTSPELQWDMRILLHKVVVKNAWEIGPYDVDQTVIRKDDQPIIPKGVKDAPVLELLRRKGEMS